MSVETESTHELTDLSDLTFEEIDDEFNSFDYSNCQLCVPQDRLEDLEFFPNFRDDLISLNGILSTPEHETSPILSHQLISSNKNSCFHEFGEKPSIGYLEPENEQADDSFAVFSSPEATIENNNHNNNPFPDSRSTEDLLFPVSPYDETKEKPEFDLSEVFSSREINSETTQNDINTNNNCILAGKQLSFDSCYGGTKEKPKSDLSEVFFSNESSTNRKANGEDIHYWRSEIFRKPRSKRPQRNSWGCNKPSLYLGPLAEVQNLDDYAKGVKRRCTHCQAEKTPQWRMGPMGPKTLCNACGVRYKSGRLLPEYRPAASPTFDSMKHSNFHRRIIQKKCNR